MKLFSSIFTREFKAEKLGSDASPGVNVYPIEWPEPATVSLGVVAVDLTLRITRNEDAEAKILEAGLRRNSDGQVIAFARIARGTEGTEMLSNGAIGGTVIKESQVLPVGPSDAVMHWATDQASGLSLLVSSFPGTSPHRGIDGVAKVLFKYVKLDAQGRPVPVTAGRVDALAVGTQKQLTIVGEDGRVWFTADGTVPNPAWVQIATP